VYKPLGLPNSEGFYQSFATSPEYKGQFASTLDQQVFNAMHTTCSACNGQGVRVTRRGRIVEREAVGCDTCQGLGVVPNV
jgi:DnaJ-class molecular chaperone